jgi:hypothetical protein
LPTTFEGLAGAILGGKFTDAQLASALTGAQARGFPEQTYLFGQRTGSGAAQVGITYTPSGRTSFHLSAMGTRMQSLKAGGKPQNATSQVLIPQSTTAGIMLGWGYELTPRTHIGVDVQSQRIFSRLQEGYTSHSDISIGRTMSPHWFVQGRVGVGYLSYARSSIATPGKIQYLAGGGIGYKMRSHTFLAEYDRTIGDAYGFGSASTSSANAGWSWKPAGSMWSMSANFGYQQMNGSVILATSNSWRANGGIARALNAHLFVSVQYAYFMYPSNAAVASALNAGSGVSMTLSWSPSQYR